MTSAVRLVEGPAQQLVEEPAQQLVEGPDQLVVLVQAAVGCDNPPLRARFYHTTCMRASRMDTCATCNCTSVGPRLVEQIGKVHRMWGAVAACLEMQATQRNKWQNPQKPKRLHETVSEH